MKYMYVMQADVGGGGSAAEKLLSNAEAEQIRSYLTKFEERIQNASTNIDQKMKEFLNNPLTISYRHISDIHNRNIEEIEAYVLPALTKYTDSISTTIDVTDRILKRYGQ